MNARGLRWLGIALIALPACAIDPKEFETLRDQVLLQQRLINDLKARQEEQVLRGETLNNGFKILGDKAEENSRRLDDLAELIGEQGAMAPVAAPAPRPAPAAAPLAAAPTPIQAPAPAPVPAPVPAPASPILLTNRPASPPAPAPDDEIISVETRPDKVYVRALETFNRRDYAGSAEQFRGFVATFPDHILAGNAQYWIGECFYTQKRFAEAAEEFGRVEQTYPGHRKVPDALLKRGLSLRELRRTAEAQGALERILAKYPQSDAAAKAREFLARWK
jgi:tol-pal system protein YbgF